MTIMLFLLFTSFAAGDSGTTCSDVKELYRSAKCCPPGNAPTSLIGGWTPLESKIAAAKQLGRIFGNIDVPSIASVAHEQPVPFTAPFGDLTFTNTAVGQTFTIKPSTGVITDVWYGETTTLNVFHTVQRDNHTYIYAEPETWHPSPYGDTLYGSEPNRLIIGMRISQDLELSGNKVYFNQTRKSDATNNAIMASFTFASEWRYECSVSGDFPPALEYGANANCALEKLFAASQGLWPSSPLEAQYELMLFNAYGIFTTTYIAPMR